MNSVFSFWFSWFSCAWLRLAFGGSSSSSSHQETKYETIDKRVAAGSQSPVTQLENADVAAGVLAKGSNNTITTVDPQIVRAAFEYAAHRDALAGETINTVLKTGQAVVASGIENKAREAGVFSERTVMMLGAAALAAIVLLAKVGV